MSPWGNISCRLMHVVGPTPSLTYAFSWDFLTSNLEEQAIIPGSLFEAACLWKVYVLISILWMLSFMVRRLIQGCLVVAQLTVTIWLGVIMEWRIRKMYTEAIASSLAFISKKYFDLHLLPMATECYYLSVSRDQRSDAQSINFERRIQGLIFRYQNETWWSLLLMVQPEDLFI